VIAVRAIVLAGHDPEESRSRSFVTDAYQIMGFLMRILGTKPKTTPIIKGTK